MKIPLIIHGRDPIRLKAIAEELSPYVSVTIIDAELVDEKERKKVVDMIRERTPDLVINNAGFGLYGEATELSVQKQLEMVDVNVKALMELSIEAARSLQSKGKHGVIVNISSAAGFLVFPQFAAYAASKAFVTSFSQAMDFEMSPHNIRVLTACPGVIETAFRERAGGVAVEGEASRTADFAAGEIWHQIQKGQRVRIFDWKTNLGITFARYLPTSLVYRILSNAMSKLKKR